MNILLYLKFRINFYKSKLKLKSESLHKIIKFLFTLSIILIIGISNFNALNIQMIFEKNKNPFIDILPKIKMNCSEPPDKTEIFKSRELFISDSKLTKEYINYIRPKIYNETSGYQNPLFEGMEPDLSFTHKRKNRLPMKKFYNLCLKEKLINNETFSKFENPLISVLIISYNKRNELLKSIRSIQNQSLKNIEIIIVNDCSSDKSEEILEYLLKTDKRIRIFTHLKNMGAWRSRLDAFLYSNSQYVIHFDAGDFYSDNYILEDSYYLVKKYNLDSIRFAFRLTKAKKFLSKKDRTYNFDKNESKIIYGTRTFDVHKYKYGTIWNRLTKSSIFTYGLYHLEEYILNARKNLFEDRWWNTMANNESRSYLMINRIGYIYLKDFKGEGHIKSGNNRIKEKMIQEIIYFLLFDYNYAYFKSEKNDIINDLRKYRKGKKNLRLSDLKSYFQPYNQLLKFLIKDKYVSRKNKLFLLSLKHEIKYNKLI